MHLEWFNILEKVMTLKTYGEFSEQELKRIERLIDAASDGPWYSYAVGRDPEAESNYIEIGSCNELGSFKSIEVVGGTIADQDFIASARQDMPRLLLEVRMLRARLESLRDSEIGMRAQTLRSAEATMLSA
jgi:hypothetical protein